MLAWADEARRYERELRGPSQGICCNSAGPGPTQEVEEGAVLAHTFASDRYVSCPEARLARPEYLGLGCPLLPQSLPKDFLDVEPQRAPGRWSSSNLALGALQRPVPQ